MEKLLQAWGGVPNQESTLGIRFGAADAPRSAPRSLTRSTSVAPWSSRDPGRD